MKKLWTLLLTLVFVVGLISPAMTTTAYAQNDVAMTVNGTEYTDHGTGWSAAVKLASGGTDVIVKLFADWIADAEKGFVCPDGGTFEKGLYVDGGTFTLDLNGHTISRNASGDISSEYVLYVMECTFTLDDTSKEKTGKITGSNYNHIEYGGGVYTYHSTFTINGGSICGNKGASRGGMYVDHSELIMNGGSIVDNESEFGSGGIFLINSNFVMNGGIIARNRTDYNGGAVNIVSTDKFPSAFYMYDGVIEDNYAEDWGGAIFLGHPNLTDFNNFTDFIMYGGVIRNNTAGTRGGGVCTGYPESAEKFASEVVINGGSIIGNVCEKGEGGGIYWDQSSKLYLSNCTITGNSAPNGLGGGVYVDGKYTTGVVFGGCVNITGNTSFSDYSGNNGNLYLATESSSHFLHDYNGSGALSPDSKIGFTAGKINLGAKIKLNESENITEELANCFVSDDPFYIINKEKRSDGYYDLYFAENPAPSCEPLLTVETKAGGKKEFCSRGAGWLYALEQVKTTDVTLTLYADWNGRSGNFDYGEEGSYSGALAILDGCKNNLTIDLNGYTINRNAASPGKKQYVFYIDCTGSLTITDSSEAQTGTITGGNNTGDGGAFYVDYGTLKIKGGNITGNKAKYGGAIYINDMDDALSIF